MPPVAAHAPPASTGSPPPRVPPGSHSSALQVSREGLKLSPPSKPLGDDESVLTTDILPSWKTASSALPAETHLWIAPANKRKRRTFLPADCGLGGEERGGGGGGGGDPVRIPAQSPVRPVEWWRRPPSPLLVHMRPLWQSSSEYSYSLSGSDLSTFSVKSAALPPAGGVAHGRARARVSPPSEGEAAAGGEAPFTLDTTRTTSPSPITPGSSIYSQDDSTFFTRKPTASPKSGGWSSSAIDAAPPPPMMAAPTPSSSGAAAAAAAAAVAELDAKSAAQQSTSAGVGAGAAAASGGAAGNVTVCSSFVEDDARRAGGAAAAIDITPVRNARRSPERRQWQGHPRGPGRAMSVDSLEEYAGSSRHGEQRRGRGVRAGGGDGAPPRPASELRPKPSLDRKLSREEVTPRDIGSLLTGGVDARQDGQAGGPRGGGSEQPRGGGDSGGGGAQQHPRSGGAVAGSSADAEESGGSGGGGGCGGNPARVSNKVVTRRAESFEKSVSTGLANAIAEMQVNSDTDTSGHGSAGGDGGGGGRPADDTGEEGQRGGETATTAVNQVAAVKLGFLSDGSSISTEAFDAARGSSGIAPDHARRREDGGVAGNRSEPGNGGSSAAVRGTARSSSGSESDSSRPRVSSGDSSLRMTPMGGAATSEALRGANDNTSGAMAPTVAAVAEAAEAAAAAARIQQEEILGTRQWEQRRKHEQPLMVTLPSMTSSLAAAGGLDRAGGPGGGPGGGGGGGPPISPPSPASSVTSSGASSTASSIASSDYSASSRASSSLATSMRIQSRRRRRGEARTRGTRPEREVGVAGRMSRQPGDSSYGGAGSGDDGQRQQQQQQQHRRGGSDRSRRMRAPSPKAPLRVGSGEVRKVNRQSRSGKDGGAGWGNYANGGGGRPGVGALPGGVAGAGRFQMGRVRLGGGRGGGGQGLGGGDLRHFQSVGGRDGVERHYVNPMNAHAQRGGVASASSHPIKDPGAQAGHSKGGFAKLLRKCMSLRKRWRRKQKQRPDSRGGGGGGGAKGWNGQGTGSANTVNDNDADSDERLEFLAEKALGTSKRAGRPRSSSPWSRKSGSEEVAAELEELARGLGMGKAEDFDGDELEMAARRLLDALWMSAKRGSDTLQLSVADGRALLTGLLMGCAPPPPPDYDPETGRKIRRRERSPEPLLDLEIPLPRALAVLTAARTASSGRDGYATSNGFQQKPLRPVLVGASGPFARAAREAGKGGSVSGSVASGSLGGGSSRGSSRGGGGSRGSSSRSKSGAARRRETAALQRAMELAMGVDDDKGSVKGAGGDPHRYTDRGGIGVGGDGSLSADEGGAEKNPHSEWAASTFRPVPSDGRVQGRSTASRARVHRELRNASEAVGLNIGLGSDRSGSSCGGEGGSRAGGGGRHERGHRPMSSFPSRSRLHTAVARGVVVAAASKTSSVVSRGVDDMASSVASSVDDLGSSVDGGGGGGEDDDEDDVSSVGESSVGDDSTIADGDSVVWNGTAGGVDAVMGIGAGGGGGGGGGVREGRRPATRMSPSTGFGSTFPAIRPSRD
eukprot:g20290.t1